MPRFVLKELQQIADSNDPIKTGARPARPGSAQSHPAQYTQRGQNPRRRFPGRKRSGRQAGAPGAQPARQSSTPTITTSAKSPNSNPSTTSTCTNWPSPCARFCCPAKSSRCASCAKAKTRARASVTCPTARWSSSTTRRLAVGQQVDAQVQSLLQTGAGVIIFADLKPAVVQAEVRISAEAENRV